MNGRERGERAARRVTLKDLAVATGLSVSSVSRALGDSPVIPAATRERVQEAARRLGYRRDPMLAALASYRKSVAEVHYHGTIAWLLVDQKEDRQFYQNNARVRRDCEGMAAGLGYRLEEFDLGAVAPGRLFRQLAARNIPGLLFPTLKDPGRRLELDLAAFAAVKIGDTLESPRLNVVAPFQMHNMALMVEKLRELGWRRIGFWLPRVIDDRVHGAFSAAFWRRQQELPAAERLEIGLPAGFDEPHFVAWLKRTRPDFIIGLPELLRRWMSANRLAPVPVSFPANTGDPDTTVPRVDENWPLIYLAALRMLDSMIRHGERGIPPNPRRILIEGTWIPGTLRPQS